MELNTIIYVLAAALCAGLVSFTMTPPVRALAFRIGAIDVPKDKRRMHNKPIPRIGGLAIFTGFVIATMIFAKNTSPLYAIWLGGSVLVVIGIIDDIYRLPALFKLVVQIFAAWAPVLFGVSIEYVSLFGHTYVLGVWEIPVTILWIVGITNAMNLIDGLDGLACGVSAICAASISCVMMLVGDTASAMLTIILTASCIGFFPFNRNPARIFMGDTGSLFLGYTLAVISVSGLFKVHTAISFLVPLAVFALPLFDTVSAFFRRILSGRSPFSPDKSHLHHKLVAMGFNQKESVRILYAICALMGLVAVVFTDTMFETTRGAKALILLSAAVLILYVNYIVMVNPASRLHSGLFEDENEESYKKLERKVNIAEKVSESGESDRPDEAPCAEESDGDAASKNEDEE